MPRLPVPDDYEGSNILVAGRDDYHYAEADVQVDADEARTLQIREDEDGRYCGPPRQHMQAVADHLGVEVPESATDDSDSADGGTDSDANPEGSDGEDGDAEPDAADLVADGVCPWCPPDDQYEGEHIGQHASSAHPDAWDEYTQE